MNPPPPFYTLPRLKRSPNTAEFEALLDLLPHASLLVDAKTKRIQLSNAKTTELTAYTRQELAGMDFAHLFSGRAEIELSDARGAEAPAVPLQLCKRNKSLTDVNVSIRSLSPQGRWVLVTLEPALEAQQREGERKRREETLGSMKTISQALHQTSLLPALELMLRAIQQLSGAEVLTIYLPDIPPLKENIHAYQAVSLGNDDIFPATLPAQDLAHLRSPQIWTTGKRPLNGVHRSARAANLAFAASAPLGESSALIGLVAVGGHNPSAAATILPQLEILAQAISALIAQHSRISHVQEVVRQLERQGAVHTVIENTIDVAVVLLTAELTVSSLNLAAEQTLGYSSAEARGQPVENILITVEGLAPLLRTAAQGLPTLNAEDIHLYRRSGQTFLARMSLIPIQTEGVSSGMIVLFEDMSEKEKIQTQANNLERLALLGEVTTIFAHEVRNPINGISTGLQLLAYNLPAEDANQEVIARLQQDCNRVNEMMKSVLAYSRPAEYEMSEVDIAPLINRLVDRLRMRQEYQKVDTQLQIDPGTPRVWGNARALEQVFTNLVTNACQAMSETGGTVTLKVRQTASIGERKYVEIDVADNGPGIPKEQLDRIFMPFFTTKANGTGLGLAITKHIITAHKGNIQVASVPGGTVFQVHLPAAEGA